MDRDSKTLRNLPSAFVSEWAKGQTSKSADERNAYKPTSSSELSRAGSTVTTRTTASNPVSIVNKPPPPSRPQSRKGAGTDTVTAESTADAPDGLNSGEEDLGTFGAGIPEDFEMAERDAALSSPIKGSNVRLSHTVRYSSPG